MTAGRRWSQYQPIGTYEEAALYIDKIEAAVNKTAAQHPGFEVNQLGSVTTTKATDAAFNNMLKTAGLVAIPLTLVILLLVFGSAVAALDPAAAGDHSRHRDDQP